MENSEIKDILLTKDEISLKVKELAEKINLDYAGKEIIIIGILKGCFVFMSDLIRELDLSLQVQFMEVSSYGDGTISRGDITIKKDVCVDISGRDVIIVEDIIDSGITLSRLKKILLKRNPKSLKICTLLSKPSRREVDITADYIGFEIPDKFVAGYGLDVAEKYRNLPYVAVFKEHNI